MQDTELIKQRLSITDVIQEHVKLTPTGSNFRGLCPFHREKTPSFFVSADRGSWKCFGCGKGGDHFTFLQEIENIDFPEALRILAQRAGVTLSRQQITPEQKNEKDVYLQILDVAARWYAAVLRQSQAAVHARAYLEQRGLSLETQQSFGVGYAPESWDALSTVLLKRGFREKDIRASGLVVEKPGSQRGYYDRFRDRIMFPIRSSQGDIIAFTGRTLKDDPKEAKYVNSPQTAWFEKSNVLYGLDKARPGLRKAIGAIVVEGQMDVIACHQAGYDNVLAPSGTAFTDQHAKQLARYTDTVIFCFDMDAAGQAALWKAMRLSHEIGLNVYALRLEGAKDPDELIKRDPQAWAAAVAARRPALEMYLDSLTQSAAVAPQDKKRIAAAMITEIAALLDPVEQDHYLVLTAQRLAIGKEVLQEVLRTKARAVRAERPLGATISHEDHREAEALAELLHDPGALRTAPELPIEAWDRREFGKLYREMKSFYTTHQLFDAHTFGQQLAVAQPDIIHAWEELQLFAAHWADLLSSGEKSTGASILALQQRLLKRQLTALRTQLQQAEQTGDRDRAMALMSSIAELNKQLNKRIS